MRRDEVENGMVLPEWGGLYGLAGLCGTRAARGAKGEEKGEARVTREEAERAAVTATEKRLSELKVVRGRAEDAREELEELETLGVEALRGHDASLVRLIRPGMRLTPEEVHETQLAMLRARLAADTRELKKMNAALECVSDDPFFPILQLRYERNLTDGEIATRLQCDRSTVVRHRAQLVRLLASRLYGV